MTKIIQYDRETLLQLRDAPASKKEFSRTTTQDVDRKVAMKKAAKIWKPSFGADPESNKKDKEKVDLSSDEMMTVSVMIDSNEILNKLTESNIDMLSIEFLKLQLNERYDRVTPIVEIMFSRVVDEPQYSKLYVELLLNICKQPGCSKIIADFIRTKTQDQCKSELQKVKIAYTRLWSLAAELNADAKNESLRKKLEEERPQPLKYTLGLVTFIGYLYQSLMVTFKTVIAYVYSLMALQGESAYECAAKLLTITGQKLESDLKEADRKPKMDATAKNDNRYYDRMPTFTPEKMFDILSALGNKETTTIKSSRVQVAIQDLLDLRKNQWKPRIEVISQGHEGGTGQLVNGVVPTIACKDELDSRIGHEKKIEVGPSTIHSESLNGPTTGGLGKGRGKIPQRFLGLSQTQSRLL